MASSFRSCIPAFSILDTLYDANFWPDPPVPSSPHHLGSTSPHLVLSFSLQPMGPIGSMAHPVLILMSPVKMSLVSKNSKDLKQAEVKGMIFSFRGVALLKAGKSNRPLKGRVQGNDTKTRSLSLSPSLALPLSLTRAHTHLCCEPALYFFYCCLIIRPSVYKASPKYPQSLCSCTFGDHHKQIHFFMSLASDSRIRESGGFTLVSLFTAVSALTNGQF